MSKIIIVTILIFGILVIPQFVNVAYAENWKKLADDIVISYKGKIISIEQLNPTTCWAALSPKLTKTQAVEVAENIGHYVRNKTGKTPSVHVFVNDEHIAIARPSGKRYIGKIKIEHWDPSAFDGQYRP